MKALVALAAMLSAPTATLADDLCQRPGMIPPAAYSAAPSVPYSIIEANKCHGAEGCAGRCKSDKRWVIYVKPSLSAREKQCVIRHEKAHLPPNLWSPRHTRKLDAPPNLLMAC
jgi:hypothetical protein